MRLHFNTVWHQVYLIPTIKITTSKMLYGYYNIELWWLKWGIEIEFKDKI